MATVEWFMAIVAGALPVDGRTLGFLAERCVMVWSLPATLMG